MSSFDAADPSRGSRGRFSLDMDSSFSTVEMEGWMNKRGGIMNKWKKRYFMIINKEACYFPGIDEARKQKGQLGKICKPAIRFPSILTQCRVVLYHPSV